MVNINDIQEHMMVHSQDQGQMNGVRGAHVGTVDCIEGGMIKLTKADSADGKHHLIPLEWVESIEDQTLHLSKSSDFVMLNWQTSP